MFNNKTEVKVFIKLNIGNLALEVIELAIYCASDHFYFQIVRFGFNS